VSGIRPPAGFRVGHWSDSARRTGCTVVLAPPGCAAAADVRGGAPGTRETQLFSPGSLVSEIHALVLAGGSAFGLAAAQGVARYLRERGVGFAIGPARVPIVPAAVLFDLGVGDPEAFPGEEAGYEAARDASDEAIPEGPIGAGTGATVGKIFGVARSSPGGFGASEVAVEEGRVVALAAVNAFGDVMSERGDPSAGARDREGRLADTARQILETDLADSPLSAGHTTLVCILADFGLDAPSLKRVAIEAHDGIARAIRPAHTVVDGDTVFAAAPGGGSPGLRTRLRAGVAAAGATEEAIRRAAAVAAIRGGTSARGGASGSGTAPRSESVRR
jgi:L-aminopeptidase/D-esterase-like protein